SEERCQVDQNAVEEKRNLLGVHLQVVDVVGNRPDPHLLQPLADAPQQARCAIPAEIYTAAVAQIVEEGLEGSIRRVGACRTWLGHVSRRGYGTESPSNTLAWIPLSSSEAIETRGHTAGFGEVDRGERSVGRHAVEAFADGHPQARPLLEGLTPDLQ